MILGCRLVGVTDYGDFDIGRVVDVGNNCVVEVRRFCNGLCGICSSL